MLPAERQKLILAAINEHGSVRTIEVAERLDVTDETIRRDLEGLEKEGRLQRTHGGAVKVREERVELPHDTREVIHMEEKRTIAKAAISLIESQDFIFLDASSTALQVAMQMPDMPVTVLTNSHLVVSALSSRMDIKVICVGGEYDPKSHSYIGPTALSGGQRYRIDKVFCSGNGIDVDHGISEVNEWQALIKEDVIKRASKLIYLADASKIGEVSSYIFAPLNSVDILVTDAGSAKAGSISERGTQVVFAKN